MKDLDMCEHFGRERLSQGTPDVGDIRRIFRIRESAGKEDHIFVGERSPVPGDKIYPIYAACVEAAAIDDRLGI